MITKGMLGQSEVDTYTVDFKRFLASKIRNRIFTKYVNNNQPNEMQHFTLNQWLHPIRCIFLKLQYQKWESFETQKKVNLQKTQKKENLQNIPTCLCLEKSGNQAYKNFHTNLTSRKLLKTPVRNRSFAINISKKAFNLYSLERVTADRYACDRTADIGFTS